MLSDELNGKLNAIVSAALGDISMPKKKLKKCETVSSKLLRFNNNIRVMAPHDGSSLMIQIHRRKQKTSPIWIQRGYKMAQQYMIKYKTNFIK